MSNKASQSQPPPPPSPTQFVGDNESVVSTNPVAGLENQNPLMGGGVG